MAFFATRHFQVWDLPPEDEPIAFLERLEKTAPKRAMEDYLPHVTTGGGTDAPILASQRADLMFDLISAGDFTADGTGALTLEDQAQDVETVESIQAILVGIPFPASDPFLYM